MKGGIKKMEISEQLEKYLNVFEEIRMKVGDDSIAGVILREIMKDRRCAEILAQRNGNGNGSGAGNEHVPPTAKQLSFLRSLGVREFPPGLSKQQASRMIDEAQANS